MDLRVVSDVLGVIRQKPAIMEMEKVEPYKRIFGTDMEPDNDEEWSNLMKRHKIKQRLKAARERRKAKLLNMEGKLSAEHGVNAPETPVHHGESERSVKSLLMEYKQMNGQVSMKNQQKKERKVSKEDIHKILSRNDAVSQGEKEITDDAIQYVPMQEKKAEDSENLNNKVFVEAVIEHRSEPDMISNEEPSMIRGESPMSEHESKDIGNNDEENDEIVSPNSEEEDKNTIAEKSKTKKKKIKRPKRRRKEETREPRRPNKEDNDLMTRDAKAGKLPDSIGGKALWKKSKSKVMPFATACTKLRRHLSEENKRQMDLLETIRILRGISKDEFYKDMNEETESESEPEAMEEPEQPEITSIEEAEEPVLKEQETEIIVTEFKEEQYESPKPDVENAETQKEVETDASEASGPVIFVEVKKKPAVQPQEKDEKEQTKVGSRVDSRWPKGHPYHTKPVEQKYMALYMKPVGKTLGRKRVLNINSLPRTAKEIQEYLKWREKMLEIAYLDEFDHLKKNSLRLFPMPLPEIETSSSSDSTMLHTERTFSQSTDRSAKRYQPTSYKRIARKNDQYKYLVYKKTTLSHTSVFKSKCKETDSVSSIKNQTKRRNNQVYKTVTETVKTKRLHKSQDFSENDVESISKDFESQMTFEQRKSRKFHTESPDSLDISGNGENDNRETGLLTTNANLGNYNTARLNREMQNSPTPTHLKNERLSLPKNA